jgi:hypothetical protein
VIDNIPALKAEKPNPCCTNVFATMSVPATVFNKKLANVATEYNLLLNAFNDKSWRNAIKKNRAKTTHVAWYVYNHVRATM